MSEQEEFTTSQAAKALGISASTVKRLAAQRDIGRMTALGRLFSRFDLGLISGWRRPPGPVPKAKSKKKSRK
jgi:excisionase family DNA binding protein